MRNKKIEFIIMNEHNTRTFAVVNAVDGRRVGRERLESTVLSAPFKRCLEEGAHIRNLGEKLVEGCHTS